MVAHDPAPSYSGYYAGLWSRSPWFESKRGIHAHIYSIIHYMDTIGNATLKCKFILVMEPIISRIVSIKSHQSIINFANVGSMKYNRITIMIKNILIRFAISSLLFHLKNLIISFLMLTIYCLLGYPYFAPHIYYRHSPHHYLLCPSG